MPIQAVAAFLRRYWRVFAVLLVMLALWLHGYGTGAESANQRWEYVTAKEAARNAEALAKAEAAASKQEQEWATIYEAHTAQLIEENRNVSAQASRLSARLAGLRLSLQPARCDLPQTAADSGATVAGKDGGQPGLAGTELVARLAACDEVTNERNMAAELLRADRASQ